MNEPAIHEAETIPMNEPEKKVDGRKKPRTPKQITATNRMRKLRWSKKRRPAKAMKRERKKVMIGLLPDFAHVAAGLCHEAMLGMEPGSEEQKAMGLLRSLIDSALLDYLRRG